MKFTDLLKKYQKQIEDYWHNRMIPIDLWIVINRDLIQLNKVFDTKITNPRVLDFIEKTKDLPDDFKAYKTHYFIMKTLKIKYKRDIEVHNLPDYWQSPDETVELGTGDCEDFTILWMKIMQLLGVPSYKCMAIVGMVDNGVKELHAYPVYFNGIRAVNMDLTCYVNVLMVSNRATFRIPNDKYLSMWWAFNWKSSYKKLYWVR